MGRCSNRLDEPVFVSALLFRMMRLGDYKKITRHGERPIFDAKMKLKLVSRPLIVYWNPIGIVCVMVVVDFFEVVVELKFLRDLVRFFGRVKLAQVRTPSGIFQVFHQDETGSLVPDKENHQCN